MARSSSVVSAGSEKLTAGSNRTVAPSFSRRSFKSRACSTARVTTMRFPLKWLCAHSCARPAALARQQRRRAAFAQFSCDSLADRFGLFGRARMLSPTCAARRPEKAPRLRATSFPFSTRPHAPIETWQPPSRPASAARSASTPLRVSASFNVREDSQRFGVFRARLRSRSRPAPPRADTPRAAAPG